MVCSCGCGSLNVEILPCCFSECVILVVAAGGMATINYLAWVLYGVVTDFNTVWAPVLLWVLCLFLIWVHSSLEFICYSSLLHGDLLLDSVMLILLFCGLWGSAIILVLLDSGTCCCCLTNLFLVCCTAGLEDTDLVGAADFYWPADCGASVCLLIAVLMWSCWYWVWCCSLWWLAAVIIVLLIWGVQKPYEIFCVVGLLAVSSADVRKTYFLLSWCFWYC